MSNRDKRRTRSEGDENRTPRDDETRAATEEEHTWTPPALLPDPDDRPGWVHRWVRTAILGEPDQQNVSMRMREGWEPCEPKDYPEMASIITEKVGGKQIIEVGGLMLCRAPAGKMAARAAYHENQAEAQMAGVESALMSNSDDRMPIQRPSTKTRTTFGSRD